MDASGYYILTEKALPSTVEKVSAPLFFRCVMNGDTKELARAFCIRNFFTTLSEMTDQEKMTLKMVLREKSHLLRLKKIFIVVDTIHPSYHEVIEQHHAHNFKEFFGSCFSPVDDAPDIFYSPATLSG